MLSIVRKTFEPVLQRFGFSFQRALDSKAWRFYRSYRGQAQFVDLVKSKREAKALKVQLSTQDDYGLDLRDLMKEEGSDEWWYYSDRRSQEALLMKIAESVGVHGLEWFESYGGPFPVTSLDHELRLLGEYQSLAGKFASAHSLNPKDPTDLMRVEAIVLERRKTTDGIDWAQVLEIGAYLGVVLQHDLSGSWDWDAYQNKACVTDLGGRPGVKTFPLQWVSNYWVKPDLRHSFVKGVDLYRRASR